jgi:hypothetical protein
MPVAAGSTLGGVVVPSSCGGAALSLEVPAEGEGVACGADAGGSGAEVLVAGTPAEVVGSTLVVAGGAVAAPPAGGAVAVPPAGGAVAAPLADGAVAAPLADGTVGGGCGVDAAGGCGSPARVCPWAG